MTFINAITEQVTRKNALEEAAQRLDIKETVADKKYDAVSLPIVPQSQEEEAALKRQGYVLYQDPNARSHSPTAYVAPERIIMEANREDLEFKRNLAYEDHQSKISNPWFNLGDTVLDIANNTIGLPFKAFGTELFNNPSAKADKGYIQKLEDISNLQGTNIGHYLEKRRERDKAFSHSRLQAAQTGLQAAQTGEYGGPETSGAPRLDANGNWIQAYADGSFKVITDALPKVQSIGGLPYTYNAITGKHELAIPVNQISNYLTQIEGAKVAGTTTGKFIAEAKTLYPKLDLKQKELEKTIKYIKEHKGLDVGTGLSAYIDPRNYIPGTDAFEFGVYVDQAQGKVFEAAYESLKGAGQITEFETKSMADALARMKKATSREEYLKAVDDFSAAQKRGLDLVEIASKSTSLEDYNTRYEIYNSKGDGANNSGGDGATNTNNPSGVTSSVDDLVKKYAD